MRKLFYFLLIPAVLAMSGQKSFAGEMVLAMAAPKAEAGDLENTLYMELKDGLV